jgi:hypothetical protein
LLNGLQVQVTLQGIISDDPKERIEPLKFSGALTTVSDLRKLLEKEISNL